MQDDLELLRRFAEEGSQAAFAELVRRKVNLVYAAALRQTRGDGHLAQDVTQAVFLALAGQAATLTRHALLTGWLFTTTRNLATKAVRTHVRWQRRELEANRMSTQPPPPEPAWEELRAVIDDAMHELPEKDRAALLLRFFENRSLAEVGAAVGVAENTARMRVERALEKLRVRLAGRGITSTAAALGVALAAQPVVAAPAGLVAAIAGSSIAGTMAGGALAGLGFMTTTKATVGVVVLAAVAGWGGYAWRDGHPPARAVALSPKPVASATASADMAALKEENRRLRDENERLHAASPSIDSPAAPDQKNADGPSALQRLTWLNDAQKSGLLQLVRVPFTVGFGELSPKFAELFALSPTETDAMQQALDKAHARIDSLVLANATTRTLPDGKIVIDVKPFEGGGAVYDEMMDAFASVLGKDRNGIFLQLVGSRGQLDGEFNQFGGEQRTVTVTATEKDGERAYDLVEQRKYAGPAANQPPNGQASAPGGVRMAYTPSRTSTASGITQDVLMKQLGPLAKLLPKP
ncbi:MAG TPA: sigma-70 family RNA polymerase sigma factor [Opitutaceae bacterium]|nr:sigma-70 family RNA polymerase sigma factor [Opitutaceae bacterium]